ncbi:MAG: hypothetical protein R3275_06225 [Saprospiraceae bacterium]|nr:hypothetical protein [Saprospiraceae bacterium]
MIFQPNLRRLLSGNSTCVVILLFAVVLSSCGTSKKRTTRERSPSLSEKQRQIKKERSRIDTVEWILNEDRKPIDDESPLRGKVLPPSQLKSSYNIDLIIPFKAPTVGRPSPDVDISAFQRRFLDFYLGAKLAADDLSNEGIDLNLKVHDSHYKEDDVRDLYFNGEFRRSDVIIGPYKKDNVKWLSERAKSSRTTMISPWISSTSMTEDNPYYIQTKPGLIRHYKTMLGTVLENYADHQVFLVVKEDDELKMRYFDYVSEQLNLDPEFEHYKILSLDTDTLTHGVSPFDTSIFDTRDCKMVFMVPYASGRDATFVYDFLRRLQIEGQDCDYKVYGMYRWLDYRDQMFELMNSMPIYLTISNLVNPFDEEIKRFRKRFYTLYFTYPSEDAYEGYDLMMYVGRSLARFGNRFHFLYDEIPPYTGLQTVFDVQPESELTSDELEYFENRFIDIISIENFEFKRVK